MTEWIVVLTLGLVFLALPFYFFYQQKSQIALLRSKPASREAIRVPDYDQTLPTLEKEYARARRHGRPLSLIVARPRSTAKRPIWVKPNLSVISDLNNMDNNNLNSSIVSQCGPIFRDTVRLNDITAYDYHNDRLIIALPESSKEDTYNVVHRFNLLLGEEIASHLSMGIAEFPDDGLFIEELIDKAENNHVTARTGRQTNASKAIHSVT